MRDETILLLGGGIVLYLAWQASQTAPLDNSSQLLIDTDALVTGEMSGLSNMTTSPAGRAAIVQREGEQYTPYNDGTGVITNGVGHVLTSGDPTGTVGQAQVDTWFNNDIAHAENVVRAYVTVPLTQNQFDALVSMAFNLGNKVFRNGDGSETQILIALNSGDYTAASAHIMDWVYAGGVVSPGIVSRRQSEQAQFNS